mgnify:CR=1 FL=1
MYVRKTAHVRTHNVIIIIFIYTSGVTTNENHSSSLAVEQAV